MLSTRRERTRERRLLADWRRPGRIGAATVAAVVVPVWMHTLDEIRRLFEEHGASVAGLELESAELLRLDTPSGTTIPSSSRGTTCGA